MPAFKRIGFKDSAARSKDPWGLHLGASCILGGGEVRLVRGMELDRGLWSPSSTVPRPLAPIRPLIPPDPSNDVERFRVTAAGIGNTSSNGGFDPRFGSHSIPGKGVPWLVGKRWGGTKVLMCWKGTSQEMWELQLDKHK